MTKIRIALALVLLGGLAHLPLPAAADEVYRIDPEVWDHFQRYLRKIGSTRPGAFAITVDGTSSYSVTCPGMQCIGGTTYSHDVLEDCHSRSGMDCVVFAVRDDIRVDYEIRK